MKKNFLDIIEETGTIFQNQDVLTIEYIPESLKFRDAQLNQMGYLSKGLNKNKKPTHMALKGGHATGKTLTAKYYIDEIENEYPHVVGVHINCKNHRTEYGVYLKIYNKLFNKQMVPGGLSTVTLYNKIINYIADKDKVLILALDEIESVRDFKEMNSALYNLVRAHENRHEAKISIMTILNEKTVLYLDNNVSTVYRPDEIRFDKYNFSQIKNIIEDRCRLAFYNGVVEDDIIEAVAEHIYNYGDLRDGIVLLEKAGKAAEYEGCHKILKRHFQ